MQFVGNEKKDYINVLDAALAPMLDFDRCEYVLNDITQQEYMRISDKLGSVAYFDITGMSLGEVLKDVCKVVLVDQARLAPVSLVTDLSKKRKIAELFRR